MKFHYVLGMTCGLLGSLITSAVWLIIETPVVPNVEVLLYVAEGQTPIKLLIPKKEAYKILAEKPLTVLRVEVKKSL